MNKAIPVIHSFPIFLKLKSENINEKFVSLSEYGFFIESQYYKQNINGSLKDCYARKAVMKKLLKAEQTLPNGYRFKIYDAYRPIKVQQELWDTYKKKIIKQFPNLSEEEINKKTSVFVSEPSYDVEYPSLHNTGGAIDLTIVDKNGKELNMGTRFDDFTDKAYTSYFEENDMSEKIKNNRRLLYWTMIYAGFTNLPSEWWHYDYGDNAWANTTGNKPLYNGKLIL